MIIIRLHREFKTLLLLAVLIQCVSCKNHTPENGDASKTQTETVYKKSSPINSKALNKQELEDSFPFRIGHYERDFLNVSDDMATSEGAFGDGKIYLKIVDSNGPIGGSIITTFNALYDLKEEMQPATIIEKKLQSGIKIVNRYETDTGNSSIEFIYINRFHIMLQGKNLTPDELWHLFEYDYYIAILKQFSKIKE